MAVPRNVPPVLAARIGSELMLLDGFHRVAAARLLGRELIEARVETVDADHAFLLTVRANAGYTGDPHWPIVEKHLAASDGSLLRGFC